MTAWRSRAFQGDETASLETCSFESVQGSIKVCVIISCKSWGSESASFNLYAPLLTHYISKPPKAALICITESHYNRPAARQTDSLKLVWKLVTQTFSEVPCCLSKGLRWGPAFLVQNLRVSCARGLSGCLDSEPAFWLKVSSCWLHFCLDSLPLGPQHICLPFPLCSVGQIAPQACISQRAPLLLLAHLTGSAESATPACPELALPRREWAGPHLSTFVLRHFCPSEQAGQGWRAASRRALWPVGTPEMAAADA